MLLSWPEVLLWLAVAIKFCTLLFESASSSVLIEALGRRHHTVFILQTAMDPRSMDKKPDSMKHNGEQLVNLGGEYTAVLCVTLAIILCVQIISKWKEEKKKLKGQIILDFSNDDATYYQFYTHQLILSSLSFKVMHVSYIYPNCTHEETEAQRDWRTCPERLGLYSPCCAYLQLEGVYLHGVKLLNTVKKYDVRSVLFTKENLMR